MIRPILIVLLLSLLIGFGYKGFMHLNPNEKTRVTTGIGFWALVVAVAILVMFALSVLF